MALAETIVAPSSGQTRVSSDSEKEIKLPAQQNFAWSLSPKQQIALTVFAALNVLLLQVTAKLALFSAVATFMQSTADLISLALVLIVGSTALLPVAQSFYNSIRNGEVDAAEGLRLLGFGLSFLASCFDVGSSALPTWELSLIPLIIVLERCVSNRIAIEIASTRIGVDPETKARVLNFDQNICSEQWVNAHSVTLGQIVRVKAGECIPLDGEIISGVGELEEQRFSRSGGLRLRMAGDEVFSGSPLHLGQLDIKVTNTLNDAVITTFVNESDDSKRNLSSEKFLTAGVWSMLVLTFAAVCAIVTVESGRSFGAAFAVAAAAVLAPLYARFLSSFSDFPALLRRAAFNRGVYLRELSTTFNRLIDCRSFIADSGVMLGEGWRVTNVRLLDERFDRQNFLGLLRALLSRCEFISRSNDESFAEGLIYEKIEQFIRTQNDRVPLFELRDFAEYTSLGMHGSVRGAEITFGTEEFLIERGVSIETGDVIEVSRDQEVLYCAVNADLVGRVELERGGVSEGEALVTQLRADGIKFKLCSTAAAASVDALGKELGLELSSIFGGLTKEQYIDKISSSKPVAVCLERSADAGLRNAADISIAPFDDFTWDLERTDITVFGKGIKALSQPFSLARRVQSALRGSKYWGLGLQLAVFGLIFLGIGPAAAALFNLAFSLYLTLQFSALLAEKNLLFFEN